MKIPENKLQPLRSLVNSCFSIKGVEFMVEEEKILIPNLPKQSGGNEKSVRMDKENHRWGVGT